MVLVKFRMNGLDTFAIENRKYSHESDLQVHLHSVSVIFQMFRFEESQDGGMTPSSC